MSQIDSAIDRIDGFAERHWRVLALLAGLTFALGCADYAGFIRLPRFALLGQWSSLALGAAYNAVWWGFAYPRIEARRAARSGKTDSSQ